MLDQGSEDCDTCAVGGVAAGAVVSSGVWGRTMVRNSRTQEVKLKRAMAVLQSFTDIGIARSQHLEHRAWAWPGGDLGVQMCRYNTPDPKPSKSPKH